ncbi:auxin efflux carrier [Piptocephalis cylindrospora]|uniref:Auxin efflux carrier n=1 Tax=Piptocephalis cylindrospora TaxID=1907219 RepID=A0A4P9Y7D5_9FUNG|nr:auxin efflux carrier [Piptocephalis cylindrospora]|eukprot:RKP13800.1 auxin efflux carrier [Piptocephalis cylindrospora]
MNILTTLALASLQSIAQVACIALFGHILARKAILAPQLQRGLSQLSITFFTPCLLFANTASSITADTILTLWPLPCYFFLFALTAYITGSIGAWAFGFTRAQKDFTIATLMFSNTNTLPIGLVQSLVFSAALPWLTLVEGEEATTVASRGIAYIVFYSLLGNVVRWSYGTSLLDSDQDAEALSSSTSASISTDDPLGPAPARSNTAFSCPGRFEPSPSLLYPTVRLADPSEEHEDEDTSSMTPTTLISASSTRPTTPYQQEGMQEGHTGASSSSSSTYGSLSAGTRVPSPSHFSSGVHGDDMEGEEGTPLLIHRKGKDDPAPPSLYRRLLNRARDLTPRCIQSDGVIAQFFLRIRNFLTRITRPFRNPPIIGALLGLVVALVPPLHDLLVPMGAPLHATLFIAIRACGTAAVPLILVCLGAQLTSLSARTSRRDEGDEMTRSGMARADLIPTPTTTSSLSSFPSPYPVRYPSYSRVLAFVTLARLLLLPALVLLVTYWTLPYVGALGKDPMFLMTVLLLGSCPTAINLMTVCQARGCYETPMGKALLAQYLGTTITMVGWCMLFLYVVKATFD